MEYAVIDIEFNQPFDFPKGRKTVLEPSCPFEVIQIGAVKMSADFEITDARSFLAKPSVYKRIHPYVRKITGLAAESFTKQPAFPVAYEEFVEFLGDNEYVFCVWGGSDIKTLFDNVNYYKLENKLTNRYIDVQMLASRKLQAAPGSTVGLKTAAESFKLDTDEDFHNALNDARYTAKIFRMLRFEDINVLCYEPALAEKGINFTLLYDAMEKELGRKLSKKERRIARMVYLLGSEHRFHRSQAKQ